MGMSKDDLQYTTDQKRGQQVHFKSIKGYCRNTLDLFHQNLIELKSRGSLKRKQSYKSIAGLT